MKVDLTLIAKAAKRLAVASLPSSGIFASFVSVVEPPLRDYVLYGAWGTLGLGVLGGITWISARFWPPSPFTSVDVATERDLSAVHKLAQGHFGRKVSTINLMRQWLKRNPHILEVVTQVRHADRYRLSTLDGYFCALPLAEKAARDLMSEARGVNDLQVEEICEPSQTPFAIYIGAIACSSESGKQVALQGLRRLVKRLARNRGDMPVLTRPITDDGMRLVKAFGFQPVRNILDDPMGVVHMQRMSALFPRGRSRRPAAVPVP